MASLFDNLFRDLRYGARSLGKAPGFALIAIVTLALGIGANTAIFSVVRGVLLTPLGYAESGRLVALFERVASRSLGRNPTSPANFTDWAEQSETLTDMTAAHPWAPVLRGDGRPSQLDGLKATPSLFGLLGVEPLLGRTFEEGDGDRVVVVGHELWQRVFGGDPELLGQSLALDGDLYTVIGVMPPGFEFPPFWATGAELWTPLVFDAETAARRQSRFLRVFARLVPGADVDRARAEMTALGKRLATEYPRENEGVGIQVEPLLEPVVDGVRTALYVLLATVGFVLLIACANVANLVLTRSLSRRREIALRAALGARRSTLVRLLLAESLLLALTGGAVGLAVGYGSIEALAAFGPSDLPRLGEIRLDTGVFAFTLGVTLLTGVLFGLAPIWQALRLDLHESLKTGGQRIAAGGRSLTSALVVAEVALALMLLVGAGLLARSLLELRSLDPGFETETVATVSVSLAGSTHAAPEAQNPFFDEVLAEVESVPGVERAAFINHLPIGGDLWGMGFTVEGQEVAASAEELPRASYRVVTPRYFDAMGIPVLQGRAFSNEDREDTSAVVTVNRTLARRFWPDGDAVGRRIKQGGPDSDGAWLTVVGVVGDVRQWQLTDEVRPEIYFPYRQNPVSFWNQTSLVVRTAVPPAQVLGTVRARIWDVDGDLPLTEARTMQEILAHTLVTRRFNTTLLALFAGLALLLSSVGIYGVMSQAVARRRGEIGVRLALGARRVQVFRLVVGQGLCLAAAGIVLGSALAAALTGFLESLLFGVGVFDPGTFAVVPAVLVGVAFLAVYVPASRAMGVDPAVSLRSE